MRKELPLRDYQADAIEKIVEAWRAGTARPAVVLPTGAGKTVVFSHLAKDLAGKGAPVVILVHRDDWSGRPWPRCTRSPRTSP